MASQDQDSRFETRSFQNLNELEAIVASLPRAKYETLHRGSEIKKPDNETELNPEEADSTPEQSPHPDQVGIINQETDKLVCTASKKYEIIQHQKAFNPVIKAMRELDLDAYGTVTKVKGGSYVNIRANFKSEVFEIQGDSRYEPGFYFRNSFNKGSSVGLEAFYKRLVCSNGMKIQDNIIDPLNRRHIGQANILELYKEWFQDLLEESEALRDRLVEAREEMLEVDIALENAKIPESKHERIKEKIEIDNDGMASRKELYDAVTSFITRDVKGEVLPATERRYHKASERLLYNSTQNLNRVPEVQE